jgi:hypothetical protein
MEPAWVTLHCEELAAAAAVAAVAVAVVVVVERERKVAVASPLLVVAASRT